MALMASRARLESVEVSLPWIKGRWVADRAQQLAAWEMYVELVTRVAVNPLADDEGTLREALSSLHALFPETRRILKAHGVALARPAKTGSITFAALALDVLNRELRPVLAKWHPLLAAHETSRPAGASPAEHERKWARNDELRSALDHLREKLASYADLLATVAGVPTMHRADTSPES